MSEKEKKTRVSSLVSKNTCPLGSPLPQSASKAARIREAAEMEGLPKVPGFPFAGAGSIAGVPGTAAGSQNYAATPFTAVAAVPAREEVPDSPEENSYDCHGCYKATCKDCSKLECVKKATAAAAEGQGYTQFGEFGKGFYDTGLGWGPPGFGPYNQKGYPAGTGPTGGKGDGSISEVLEEM